MILVDVIICLMLSAVNLPHPRLCLFHFVALCLLYLIISQLCFTGPFMICDAILFVVFCFFGVLCLAVVRFFSQSVACRLLFATFCYVLLALGLPCLRLCCFVMLFGIVVGSWSIILYHCVSVVAGVVIVFVSLCMRIWLIIEKLKQRMWSQ